MGYFTPDQYQRLQQAYDTKKYGLLATWKELYWYQRVCGNTKQIKEIAQWAKKSRTSRVLLPLIRNIQQPELMSIPAE